MGRKKVVEQKEEKVVNVPSASGKKKKRRESQKTRSLRRMKEEQKGLKPIFRNSTCNKKIKQVLSNYCEKYNSNTQRCAKESRVILKSFVTASMLKTLELCRVVIESEGVLMLFPKHVALVETLRNA